MNESLTIFLQSFTMVALSEMGDKTQLLAIMLVMRFKTPWQIMLGIFFATMLNHGLASWAGEWLANLVSPGTLRYILAATFFLFALWILIPDKADESKQTSKFGPFVTTLIAFFLAEMGDKTQLATVALGARFQSTFLVTVGTTAGMMASNGLAVLFGERLTRVVPLKYVRIAAALSFVGFAAAVLLLT
jgi:putative Ca2+/H+ antiporter (TMEM165/GDT1 family)